MTTISQTTSALRRLYFVRAAFAIVWAALAITAAEELSPLTAALFVIYPLFDAGAGLYDLRCARTSGSPNLLYANIVISLIAAAGVGAASTSGIPAVLRVWGAWAVAAGLVQLAVGVTRRTMGGHWPMIISGGLSVLAGGSFIASAGAADPALANAAGYAVPGAVFFLIAAVRLGRTRESVTQDA